MRSSTSWTSSRRKNLPESKRPPLWNGVDRAFKYYPYGMVTPRHVSSEFVYGPTFIVRAEGYKALGPEDYGTLHWRENQAWQIEATRLLSRPKLHLRFAEVADTGHLAGQQRKVLKNGNVRMQGSGECPNRAVLVKGKAVFELATPLAYLAKKSGADVWRVEATKSTGPRLYGFRDSSLVVVLAPRTLGELCRP